VYVCSLRYPARQTHALYCHLWPDTLYNIFHIISNTARFPKKGEGGWLSLQLLSETFHILRRTERDMIKNVYRSACKVPVILFRFQRNLNFSWQIFEKYSQTKFHENPSSESWVVPCAWTDRHEANSHFSHFCERIYRMSAKVLVHLCKNGAALYWKSERSHYNKNMWLAHATFATWPLPRSPNPSISTLATDHCTSIHLAFYSNQYPTSHRCRGTFRSPSAYE
jgi:hypothetical protein